MPASSDELPQTPVHDPRGLAWLRERAVVDVQARESERRRIAAELHDQVGASLSAIKLMLQLVTDGVQRHGRIDEQLLAECQETLDEGIRGVRELCAEWRPALLEYRGLVAALDGAISRFVRRTRLRVDVELSAYDPPRPPEVELMLLRVVQEALRNCDAHARASRVRVVIERRKGGLNLTIEDDGAGFDVAAPGSAAGDGPIGIGLLNMRDRALAAGAVLTLESAPGRGTRVVVAF